MMSSVLTTADSAKVIREYAKNFGIDDSKFNLRYIKDKQSLVDLVNKAWEDSLNNSENESEQQQAQAELNTYVDQQANDVAPEFTLVEETEEDIHQRIAKRLADIGITPEQTQAELEAHVDQQAEEVAPEFCHIYLTFNDYPKATAKEMEQAYITKPEPTQAPTTNNSEPDSKRELLERVLANGDQAHSFVYALKDYPDLYHRYLEKYNSEPTPKPANNTVSFRRPAAPRRVIRRASEFTKMLTEKVTKRNHTSRYLVAA